MQWHLINENLEIDTRLITCAEYQLFIEKTKTIGQHYQPRHWHSDRFPPGNAKKPITGISGVDAEAFCQWLTQQHHSYGFQYRLPTIQEAETYLATDLDVAFWCHQDSEFILAGVCQNQWQLWQRQLSNMLERYFPIDCLAVLSFAFDYVSTSDIDLYLILKRLLLDIKNQDSDKPLIRARNHTLNRIHHQVYQLAGQITAQINQLNRLSLELEHKIVKGKDTCVHQVELLAFDLENKLLEHGILIFELTLIPQVYGEQQEDLSKELNLIYNLVNKRNQAFKRARKLTHIFSQDLVSILIPLILDACEINSIILTMHNLDLSIFDGVEQELDDSLTLVEELNYPRFPELKLLLECANYFKENIDQQSLRYYLIIIGRYWHWLSDIYQKFMTNQKIATSQKSLGQNYQYLTEKYLKKRDEVIKYYIALILLEQRQKEKIESWEGLRLVREKIAP